MVVRLVASDLDGTLFGPDALPEPRTTAAVNAVVDAGIVFAAVTGRSYFGGAGRLTDTGTTTHWFIGSNGGHRLNMVTGELEERLLFSADHVSSMLEQLPTKIPGLGFGFEHAAGFTFDDAFRQVYPDSSDGGSRIDTAPWAVDDIGKIFVTHRDLAVGEMIELASTAVPDGTHVSTSGGSFVELTPAGGAKGLALSRLCDRLGIAASEVVAFGDNTNDLSMLEWARRGIAMANATADALDIADEVTAANTDFGVAMVLESLVPG